MAGQCLRDATTPAAAASESSLPRSKPDAPAAGFGGYDMPEGVEDQWASLQLTH